MRFLLKSVLALCVGMAFAIGARAANYAWPANWEGVMLQGFYWDSYSDTRWTNLTAQSDELSKFFKLIWVPNSAKAATSGMGYDPVYWFTNHNTRFGTEAQLRQMIQTYKEKGVGIIADVVINHRSGRSNWTDFPVETWNGRTWKIGPEGICSTDEVKDAAGQAKPTGAADTGENFAGSRDLDHTNANVQDNCKNYCKFLLDDLGYAGFRLDMSKGYAGRFTKIYNEYSKPTYSVGEYWDGSYDALAAWINATGKQSAAFDFAFKYAVNDAFATGDMTKLVWKANGTTPQPAGLIHFGYSQYAVTFIDNHDTYRDDWNKFKGNVVAANAFMLMSPGAPCVFLPHYKSYKTAICKLIDIRNSVGVHNNSAVNVLQTNRSCYMAEVTGSKGKVVVKIGSAMVSPAGYSDADIVASGTDYCVWTKVKINWNSTGDDPVKPVMPDKLYLMGHLPQGAWATNVGVSMVKKDYTYVAKNVTFVAAGGEDQNAYFSFVTALGTTGATSEWDDVINASDRYGATTKDAPIALGGSAPMLLYDANGSAGGACSWKIKPGSYDIIADFANMVVRVVEAGSSGIDDVVADDNAEPVYYNLQGVRVDNPSHGIYIKVSGNKVAKVKL